MIFDRDELAAMLSRTWWVMMLRGVIAILFGIVAWILPAASLAVLLLLFGAYALLDGILGVWVAISGRKERDHWWVLLIWGLTGIGIGLLTLMAPGVTAIVLLFYIAIWAMMTGVLQIIAAIRLRKEVVGEWLFLIGGIASLLFGIVLISRPGVGILALIWLIATYAVLFGLILVFLGFKLRTIGKRLSQP